MQVSSEGSPSDNAASQATHPLLRAGMVAAGLCGAAGVVLAALGTHMDATGLMSVASNMLLFHAPAFLGLGALAQLRRVPLLPVAFVLLLAGVALFSGDLVSRALTADRLFAMSAPTGGSLMICGWLAVLLSAAFVRPR